MSPRRRSEAAPLSPPADRDQIRRGFLGLALCHELKQPLHSLNLNLELLSQRLARVPTGLADVEGPMQALGRVVDRINECLDAFASRSMPESTSTAAIDLGPVLAAAVERVGDRARRAGVQILLRASPLPPISASPEQIAVAVDALLDNAIRASPAGGEVVLSALYADADVRIDVADHGSGMTADVARHAVDIGFSTWGGHGIGLTVAKFITYHHAGGFQLTSAPGKGTTVSMILPATDLSQ